MTSETNPRGTHDPAPFTLPPPGEAVRFSVDSDDSAHRITAVLGALGFDVTRDLPDEQSRVAWRVERVSREYRLSTHERACLEAEVEGRDLDHVQDVLGVSRQTATFVRTNMLAKIGAVDNAGVLRIVGVGR